MTTLDVRVIVGFDAGQEVLRNLEGGRELAKRLIDAALLGRGVRLDLLEREQGVGARHVDQLLLLAALGDAQRDFRALLLPEPRLDNLHLLDMGWQQNLRRHERRVLVVLFQELRGCRLDPVFAFGAFEEEVLLPDQLAAANEEHLDARPGVVGHNRHHILVAGRGRDDLLPLADGLDSVQRVAQLGRPLELHVVRGGLHLAFEILDQLVLPTGQKQLDILDALVVALLIRHICARRFRAAAHVMIEAGALILGIGPRLAAGHQRKHAINEVHRLIDRVRAGERSEVAVAVVLLDAARNQQSGKRLGGR